MQFIGTFHLAASVVALLSGAFVLMRTKGSVTHRRLGWLYASSMIALNISALLIYRLTGSFGPFHIAAVLSLATLLAGLIPAVRRPRAANWLDRHYFFMSYSYLGLVAAAVAETATRVPALSAFAGGPTAAFWTTVAIVSFAVIAIGTWIIRRSVTATLAPLRAHPSPLDN